jgi:hypothetical protein
VINAFVGGAQLTYLAVRFQKSPFRKHIVFAAPMLTCFANDLDKNLLDRQPFKFAHRLMGHPALELENLGRVLPALKPEQVFFSKSTRNTGEDLDRLHLNQRNGLSIEETIHNIKTSDSYIMVRSPETDPSFADLHKALLADVESLIQARGAGRVALESMLYMFIASPNSVTPFHIDRYSTFLTQFRGSKTVTVFPAWDKRVVNPQECEDYVAYSAQRGPKWSPQSERYGTAFEFSPGEALHIPFLAGHHVRNGADDVSISLSIIFKTDETERLRNVILFNRKARKLLSPVGLEPSLPGQSESRDFAKAGLYGGMYKAYKAYKVLRSQLVNFASAHDLALRFLLGAGLIIFSKHVHT